MIVEHASQFFVGDFLGRGRDSEIEHACGLSLHEDESSEITISCKQEVVASSGFLQELNRHCPHVVVCKEGHEAEGDT